MKMKRFFLSIFCLLMGLQLNAQKLSKKQVDSLNLVIDSMLAEDQSLRWMLIFNTTNKQRIDSFKALSYEISKEYILGLMRQEIRKDKELEDSLWVLQNKIDTLNTLKSIELLKKYGRLKGLNYSSITIFFLHSPQLYWKEVLETARPLIGKNGFSSYDYANIYDKYQLIDKKEERYYVFIHPDTGTSRQPKDCIKTNADRAEIGLKPLKCK